MNIRKEIFLGVRRQGFYKFRKPRSEQEINSLLIYFGYIYGYGI